MSTLPGSERYKREWTPQRRPSKTQPYIDKANTIPIIQVLLDVCQTSIPTGMTAGSWKTWCPFSFEHPDRIKKGFRVYEITNTSHCFILHGSMRPVRLVQLAKELPAITAAYWLLDHYDMSRPRSYKARFNELLVAREQRSSTLGSSAYLVEALQVELGHVDGYEMRQFDTDVTTALEAELEGLDKLLVGPATEAGMHQWYTKARDRLVQIVKEGEQE